MRTIQQLAQDAIRVQNACNLSGIVHGFAEAIVALRELCPGASWDTIDHHPICMLWSDKIQSMTGSGRSYVAYHEALMACEELAKPDSVTVSK